MKRPCTLLVVRNRRPELCASHDALPRTHGRAALMAGRRPRTWAAFVNMAMAMAMGVVDASDGFARSHSRAAARGGCMRCN